MDRRQFLATATAATALPLAGCSAATLGTTDLGVPETETDHGDTHLTFTRDDERLLTLSLLPRGRAGSGGPLRFRLSAWHADGTRLDNFRVAVRAPARGGDPATNVYLQTPWYGDHRSLEFYHGDRGRSTVVSVDDFGEAGDATLSVEFLLDPVRMPETLPVRVSGEFEFSETGLLGDSYRAEGATTVEIPRRQHP